jgi:acyl carrier protein
MKESEVIDIISKELSTTVVNLDTEGLWDSLDLITVLMALDVAYNEKLKDIRELQTVKTPRDIIEILKTHGLVDC